MPSARAHDLITLVLAPPTYAATLIVTGSADLSVIVTGAMLFAGLMFGPDLDIDSRQQTRWGPFRFLWWPYKLIFKHRSRLSHGIILSTAVRVIYFAVMVTLLLTAGLFLVQLLDPKAGERLDIPDVARQVWHTMRSIETRYLVAGFVGLWWGATSHTLTDWLSGIWKSTKRIF